MKRVLYDSDLIGDDLLTLIAISADSSTRLEAVTSYGRRIGAVRRCEIARELLERLPVSGVDIVPGCDRPLIQEPIAGCEFCDHVIERLVVKDETATDVQENKPTAKKYKNHLIQGVHAANYLIEKTRKEPGIYSLLCTGPLTNIALAAMLDPTFPERLAEVVIMGGVWAVSGNSGPKMEANIFNDPDAARVVFDRFKKVIVVPLDVTLHVAFERKASGDTLHNNNAWHFSGTIHELGKQGNNQKEPSDMRVFIEDLVNSCCDAHLEKGTGNRMPLHDLLAFLVLTDRSFVTTRKCSINVETRSRNNRGMMIFDFTNSASEHELATEVDEIKALKMATKLLEGF